MTLSILILNGCESAKEKFEREVREKEAIYMAEINRLDQRIEDVKNGKAPAAKKAEAVSRQSACQYCQGTGIARGSDGVGGECLQCLGRGYH